MYDTLGEYNQAKELHEKALTIFKEIFGEDHGDVATSYDNLALVYNRPGEYNQAKELHEKALLIRPDPRDGENRAYDNLHNDFWWRSCRCSN